MPDIFDHSSSHRIVCRFDVKDRAGIRKAVPLLSDLAGIPTVPSDGQIGIGGGDDQVNIILRGAQIAEDHLAFSDLTEEREFSGLDRAIKDLFQRLELIDHAEESDLKILIIIHRSDVGVGQFFCLCRLGSRFRIIGLVRGRRDGLR